MLRDCRDLRYMRAIVFGADNAGATLVRSSVSSRAVPDNLKSHGEESAKTETAYVTISPVPLRVSATGTP